MSLFDNIPEGTDIIEIRKKVNKMLSEKLEKNISNTSDNVETSNRH